MAATTASPPFAAAVEPAISALLKYKATQTSNEKLQLLPSDDYIYLNIALKKIPNCRTNPFRVPLPHPILDQSSEICLIIDDRPKTPTPPSDQIKKLIKSQSIPISKVIRLSKLKTNYKPFEGKRKLCDSFDLFLVDKRIVHLLPKLIGKEFFKKKKLPLGVDLSKSNLKLQVEKALGSALLYLRTGTCCVMKVGKVAMEKDEILENVVSAIEGAVEKVPKKWDGVRSLHLKFFDSVSLPVYEAMPDFRLKIEGLKDMEKRVEIAKASDSEAEVKESGGVKSGKKKTKGRIHEVRYMDVGDAVESHDDVDRSKFVPEEGIVMEEIDGVEDEKIEDDGLVKTVGKKRKVEADKSAVKKTKKIEVSESGVKKGKSEKSGIKKTKKAEVSGLEESDTKKLKSDKSGAKKTKKSEVSGGEESDMKKVKLERSGVKKPKKSEVSGGDESDMKKVKSDKSGVKKSDLTGEESGVKKGKKKTIELEEKLGEGIAKVKTSKLKK